VGSPGVWHVAQPPSQPTRPNGNAFCKDRVSSCVTAMSRTRDLSLCVCVCVGTVSFC
jgi:hypothetical protein